MKKYKKASEIKVGVVGYGGAFNMGSRHLEEMSQAGMQPVAVAEIDASRLEIASRDFPGIETYGTVAGMLKKSDVDLLAIITPHNTHAKLALQCLNAGRHVICEKPLAITTAECDKMIAAAKRNKALLSTYHNRHWDGCILEAVRQLIGEKAIGDIVRIEAHIGSWGTPRDWWRSNRKISGGILYDWGVHLLEYTLQLMRADIVEVSAYAKTGFWAPKTAWKQETNEDEAFAVIRYANGAWSSLCVTQLDSNPKRSLLEITGTLGTYVMDATTWKCITHDGEVTVTREGVNPAPEGWRFYLNIAEHLTGKAPLTITPEWSRRPIHILDLAVQSAKKNRALPAKYR